MIAISEAGAIETQVNQQIILAMKAHDAVCTTTLRLIKSALKNQSIAKRAMLTSAEEQQALGSMIKQRRDSIEQFTKGNRPEWGSVQCVGSMTGDRLAPPADRRSAKRCVT
jgi:hypothetical protein